MSKPPKLVRRGPDVERVYGIGLRMQKRLVDEGRVPIVKIGGAVYFRTADLDDLIARSTVPAHLQRSH